MRTEKYKVEKYKVMLTMSGFIYIMCGIAIIVSGVTTSSLVISLVGMMFIYSFILSTALLCDINDRVFMDKKHKILADVLVTPIVITNSLYIKIVKRISE